MTVSKYFKGKGEKVMKAMKKQYKGKKAEEVFYATANKMEKSMHGSKLFSKKQLSKGYMVHPQ